MLRSRLRTTKEAHRRQSPTVQKSGRHSMSRVSSVSTRLLQALQGCCRKNLTLCIIEFCLQHFVFVSHRGASKHVQCRKQHITAHILPDGHNSVLNIGL
eukprot:1355538-Amphidinium_carterae.1